MGRPSWLLEMHDYGYMMFAMVRLFLPACKACEGEKQFCGAIYPGELRMPRMAHHGDT
jgi:hypothetical protein